ncbi:hypothetical protein ASE75_04840 [Sphingomonas sp. Leaf17]|uniref:glycosyltransferase family 2 protein n=1 Tax=Sphingomonas sp. Leaf17 TaxID=1735683 RepID=UPI0006FFBA4D|nr:hypothetical protein [Sphingomonas sp. Leaf17]KQM65587.1 hypothetical protein ASE75_04840 [Sphingomonas sp. Leaf17]
MSGNTFGTNGVGKEPSGIGTGRLTKAASHAEMVRAARDREKQLIATSPWFDSAWYLTQYPDVEAAGVDPVDHFVTYGWRERRNPSAYFHTSWYLANNPDVDETELNPLLHFIEHGQAENRPTNPDGRVPTAIAGGEIDARTGTRLSARGTAAAPHGIARASDGVHDGMSVREREDLGLLQSSPLFDADWYSAQYPDAAAMGMAPERHYLHIGGFNDHDPGPRFKSGRYLASYADVAGSGLNPLIHFLRYGQAEGRKGVTDEKPVTAPPAAVPTSKPVKPARVPAPAPADTKSNAMSAREQEDVGLLRSSPLFDADWYTAEYPAAAATGMTPERHYLQIGGFSDHNPSPRFRSAWYLSNYTDVAGSGLNPLIHFLRYGQAEGRRTASEEEITVNAISPDTAAAAAEIAASTAMPVIDSIKPTPNFVVVSMQGQTMGLVPHDWSASPPQPLQAMLAMARLHDWDDRIAIDLRTSAKTMNRRETPPLVLWDFKTLAPFEVTNGKVADCWFSGDYDLRLRIDPVDGATFTGDHRLRFHQSNMTEMALCGESLLRGEGPAFVGVKLLNPFKPVLITVTDDAGLLVSSALIPFPSLLRGGAHHAEVVAMGERAARMSDCLDLSDTLFRETVNWDEEAAPFSIARIDIDLCGATGSERIFDPLVREWLAEVFKLGVSAVNADTVEDRRARSSLTKTLLSRDQLAPAIVQSMTDRRLAGHTSLVIPHDSLPSLSAIASRRLTPTGADPLHGCYLMANATTGKAVLSVTIPTVRNLDAVQPNRPISYPRLVAKSPAKKPIENPARHAPWPLAIRFVTPLVNPAVTLLPHAPDASTPPLAMTVSPTERAALRVVAIVSGNGGLPALEKLLPSLAGQNNAENLHVVLAANRETAAQNTKIERLLGALFPKRHTMVNCASNRPAAQINEAARAAKKASHLLFVDSSMILHDPRTLDTMLAIATQERVATVGCPHVRQIAAGDAMMVSAGAYFPVRLSLSSNPGIVFEEPKTPAIMIHATMPVAANSMRFVMISAPVWRKLGGLADAIYPVTGGDIEFGLRALGKKYVHLNTSAVTVTDSAHRPSGQHLDVVATGYMPVHAWQDIAASTAVVRELR